MKENFFGLSSDVKENVQSFAAAIAALLMLVLGAFINSIIY